MIRKQIVKWLRILLIVYVLGGIALYFFQDKLLFHPQPLKADYQFKFDQPFKEVNLAIDNDRNLSIVQFTVDSVSRKGVVLYFHGNRNNIARYGMYARNFTHAGYEIWMMDYPGYGKSTGKRTEKGLYKDAMLLYKLAAARFRSGSIVIYGKSLGTGIATYLAANVNCEQLILETPYYSMRSLMSHYAFMYPVSLMAHYELPTNEWLKRVQVPVTILHGSNDEVIPFSQSQKLLKEKPSAKLIEVDGGRHNNLDDFPLFHATIDSLLLK